VATLALVAPPSRGAADMVRWRRAADVTEVHVVIHEVSVDALRAVSAEYEPPNARVAANRKGFSVLRTFADGSRHCDIWLLEGMVTKIKLETLGHETAHCAGYDH
jgi:hypothetical protein